MDSMAYTKYLKIAVMGIIATALFVNLTLVDQSLAAPAGAHHSFLGGPWEIIIKMHLDDEGLRFPLTVSDETMPQKLDIVLPINDKPIEIRLEDYVPDLKWTTNAVKVPDGEIVAKLLITGKNLKQDIWLSSGDPARQSISSSIGSVTIKRFHDIDNAEMLAKELTDSKAVGIFSIRPEDDGKIFEYIAKISETIRIPRSDYKLTALEYMPHYSVNTETKKVVNQSQEPVNPAIKVAIDDGKKTYEQWLWAKFPAIPHKQETELPLNIRFIDFDLREATGKYILAAANGTNSWLLMSKKGKKRVEKAVIGRRYPFADKNYSFSIENIINGAIVKTDWANGSEKLLHPAVIATIKENSTSNQAVLELNKPMHQKLKSGTLVMLYRRTQES